MKKELEVMIQSWERKDNFQAEIDLSKEEANFYLAVKDGVKTCYLSDCVFSESEGCRVKNLGVSGVCDCVKYRTGG